MWHVREKRNYFTYRALLRGRLSQFGVLCNGSVRALLLGVGMTVCKAEPRVPAALSRRRQTPLFLKEREPAMCFLAGVEDQL